jgi:hypothetical protein
VAWQRLEHVTKRNACHIASHASHRRGYNICASPSIASSEKCCALWPRAAQAITRDQYKRKLHFCAAIHFGFMRLSSATCGDASVRTCWVMSLLLLFQHDCWRRNGLRAQSARCAVVAHVETAWTTYFQTGCHGMCRWMDCIVAPQTTPAIDRSVEPLDFV